MATANSRTSKKRPAPSQVGPKSKKIYLHKSEKPTISDEPKKIRRGMPVTLPQKEDTTSSEDEDEVEESESADEDAGMQVDDRPAKDPNTVREAHKAQRILLDQRRAAKPNASLLADAKRIWNLARQKNIGQERKKHINDLMDVVRGKIKDIVFKHDASRIVQTIVRWGGFKQREEVAMELKGTYKDLAQNKYSKFLVTKLIRFCPSQRASILFELQGHVLRLLLHREASSVIADAFELYANAYERFILVRDFYGKETTLFSDTLGSEQDKERAKAGLKGVLEGVSEERRRRVLNATKENLVTIFNNPDKGAITHAVFHRAVWEYLSIVNEMNNETEREKLWRDMFESCQEVLAELVHTKDGARAVRDFVARGTAKDRKHIIKSIKPYVERMCQEDVAQLVLFSALDIIDDTKLLAKSLVADITASASSLWKSAQGRRSLLYLIAPRSRRHYMPFQIATFAEIDDIRAKTSKKDDSIRTDEIRRASSEKLLEFVAYNGEEVARDTAGSLLVTEIMLQTDGDKTAATETLLKLLSFPYPSPDPAIPHPIDFSHMSRMYKTLLQGGHYDHTSKTISISSTFSASLFASSFLRVVGEELTVAFAKGGGAFVVAELCETIRKEGSDAEMATVRSWFSDGTRKEINQSEAKGKNVLLKTLDALSSPQRDQVECERDESQ